MKIYTIISKNEYDEYEIIKSYTSLQEAELYIANIQSNLKILEKHCKKLNDMEAKCESEGYDEDLNRISLKYIEDLTISEDLKKDLIFYIEEGGYIELPDIYLCDYAIHENNLQHEYSDLE